MADAHANRTTTIISSTRAPGRSVGAIAAFVMASAARIAVMHNPSRLDSPPWLLLVGLVGVLYTMFAWWRDVIKEATRRPHAGRQLHLRYGMILFIASEVMFFVAWFWAFFDAACSPIERSRQLARGRFTGGDWPPQGHRGRSIPGTCRCSTR